MKKSVIILLHMGYWLVFLFLLLLFFLLFSSFSPERNTTDFPRWAFHWMIIMLPFAIIPGLISFYTFYHVLFSRLLKQKKILALFIAGIAVSIGCGIIGEITISLIYRRVFPGWEPTELILIVGVIGFGALMNGVIGLVMNGFITWYGDIKLKEDLNKKNYEMELDLIRSQINPHFLFNTINNIDVLIQLDAVKASAYLNKLSDIMRFMLYEAKTEKIPLSKELSYIEKYIELQKIRTSNPNFINYVVSGNPEHQLTEPMLFIPFIENAFKHAENKKTENGISIRFFIEPNKITFSCENSYTLNPQIKPEQSGLGNELIKKRLLLLYPKKHTLDVTDTNGVYKITLVIDHDN